MDIQRKISLEDREYTLIMFSPTQAHEFFWGLAAAESRRENLAPFMRRALEQCRDPMMRRLNQPGHFEQWFSEHPEDLVALAVLAKEALVEAFFPKAPATGKTATG